MRTANKIFEKPRLYDDARNMVGVANFLSTLMFIVGALLTTVGLYILFVPSSAPYSGVATLFLNRLAIAPGLVLVWAGINGLANSQVRSATLDAAEAAVKSYALAKAQAKNRNHDE